MGPGRHRPHLTNSFAITGPKVKNTADEKSLLITSTRFPAGVIYVRRITLALLLINKITTSPPITPFIINYCVYILYIRIVYTYIPCIYTYVSKRPSSRNSTIFCFLPTYLPRRFFFFCVFLSFAPPNARRGCIRFRISPTRSYRTKLRLSTHERKNKSLRAFNYCEYGCDLQLTVRERSSYKWSVNGRGRAG